MRGDLSTPVADIGGGSARLAAELLADGHTDVTVIDLWRTALGLARARLGDHQNEITWVTGDIRTRRPARRLAIWHDRTVLHFLTEPEDRERHLATLRQALKPGGHAIIAAFAPDGPERCSGLPVVRSTPGDLLDLLGRDFAAVRADRQEHQTPSGPAQAFSWIVAYRIAVTHA